MQKTSSTTVSVLVPVFNEGRTIKEVVRAMTAQQLDGCVEFVFADGRSTDDTKAQLEQLALADPRIRVLENPRRGVASGLNVCLGAARGSYVARMDGHALFAPDYLQAGIERLAAAERGARENVVTWVAGPQVPQPRSRVGSAIAAALATRLGQGASRRWASSGRAAEEEYELDTGVFCGVWHRHDVLAKGGWDEAWLCNEDSELAARFHDAGERIICLPSMAASYIPRDSFAGLWRQYRAYGSYRVKTACRHPRSLRRSAVLAPLLVLDTVAAVSARGGVRGLARAGLCAYAAVLAAAAIEAPSRAGVASRESDRALVAVALATMHLAHGVGFIEGCMRWGVPYRALFGLTGFGRQPAAYDGPVEAPSLFDGRPASR
jgi:succinoglycan biosynthesis protein ExoA